MYGFYYVVALLASLYGIWAVYLIVHVMSFKLVAQVLIYWLDETSLQNGIIFAIHQKFQMKKLLN